MGEIAEVAIGSVKGALSECFGDCWLHGWVAIYEPRFKLKVGVTLIVPDFRCCSKKQREGEVGRRLERHERAKEICGAASNELAKMRPAL